MLCSWSIACKGYEYNSNTNACELWKVEPRRSFPVGPHVSCNVKEVVQYEKQYGAACRTRSMGKGKNGVHYTRRGNVATESACRAFCSDDRECKAYEYNRDNDACELWKEIPPKAQDSGHHISCNVKEVFPAVDFEPWDDSACRTKPKGGVGQDGLHYERVTGITKDMCRRLCADDTDCKAYESSPYGGCELWKFTPQPSGYISNKIGCFIKDDYFI